MTVNVVAPKTKQAVKMNLNAMHFLRSINLLFIQLSVELNTKKEIIKQIREIMPAIPAILVAYSMFVTPVGAGGDNADASK